VKKPVDAQQHRSTSMEENIVLEIYFHQSLCHFKKKSQVNTSEQHVQEYTDKHCVICGFMSTGIFIAINERNVCCFGKHYHPPTELFLSGHDPLEAVLALHSD